MGTLYLVATPIGNLEDISARAVRVLSQVQLIAAEDTRQTRKLLSHYQFHTPLTSYYEHNKLTKLDRILAALQTGDVALVSDAGTPALNDPGYELVRATLQAGHTICPIPGPSAPLAALVASGLPTDTFLYLGYLPRKSRERKHMLQEIAHLPYTLIFLESPHRLLEALDDLFAVLGDRQAAVARELTKIHEEIYRGSLSDIHRHYTEQQPRGEITLVVAGRLPEVQIWSASQVSLALEEARKEGLAPAKIARNIAAASGWARSEVYNLLKEIPPTTP